MSNRNFWPWQLYAMVILIATCCVKVVTRQPLLLSLLRVLRIIACKNPLYASNGRPGPFYSAILYHYHSVHMLTTSRHMTAAHPLAGMAQHRCTHQWHLELDEVAVTWVHMMQYRQTVPITSGLTDRVVSKHFLLHPQFIPLAFTIMLTW